MNRKIEHIVTKEQNGQKLQKVLKSMGLSERQIRSFKFIDGAICLNGSDRKDGRRITTGTVVLEGQKITVFFYDKGPSVVPMKINEASDIAPTILWEDPYLVFINKPAGLVVHPAGAHYTDTLANYLAERYQEPARLIGRLDKETSGVIAAARDPLTLRKAEAKEKTKQGALEEASYRREYAALVHGSIEEGGEITLPLRRMKCPMRLGKNGRPLSLMLTKERIAENMIPESELLEAATYYKPLGKKELAGETVTLVRVVIKTGRMHQIRTHMAAIGHPLLFDGFYGKSETQLLKELKAENASFRTMLHSESIQMIHPITEEKLRITAPYPKDFECLLTDFTWF